MEVTDNYPTTITSVHNIDEGLEYTLCRVPKITYTARNTLTSLALYFNTHTHTHTHTHTYNICSNTYYLKPSKN